MSFEIFRLKIFHESFIFIYSFTVTIHLVSRGVAFSVIFLYLRNFNSYFVKWN